MSTMTILSNRQQPFECEGMDPDQQRVFVNFNTENLPVFIKAVDFASEHALSPAAQSILHAFGLVLKKACRISLAPSHIQDRLAEQLGITLFDARETTADESECR